MITIAVLLVITITLIQAYPHPENELGRVFEPLYTVRRYSGEKRRVFYYYPDYEDFGRDSNPPDGFPTIL